MARRGSAVHIVTTTRSYKGRLYKTHLLRRSYREDGKVKNETLGNLSHLPEAVIELIRRALRGETPVPSEAAFQILRSRPHGHVAAVLGTLQKLGFERILASRPSPERDRCVAPIAARMLAPGSKLATARTLHAETATSTLGEMLHLDRLEADDLYAAMDWLLERQPKIEQALAKRHLSNGTLALYDVSFSYCEGRHRSLARIGHSRDGKKGSLQIVYGLLCNAAGCSVAVEVYEGNTADPRTPADRIGKVRQRFGLERVVFVADRGLLTSARIDAELRPVEGLDWIGALRSEQIRKLAGGGGPLQRSLFDTTDLAEIRHPDFPDERLIACLNPLLEAERARKLEELLRATERELDQVVAATRRERRALRGQDRIGLRVGKVLNRFKVAKHFEITIAETAFEYRRKQGSIAAEARLDGIHVLRTSVPAAVLDGAGVVRAYKGLAAVERAFRCLKTVELHVRPIYHHLEARVRAHVLLCMLAYYVEWHMRQALAPLLFAEDDPATPSESAERKAAGKRSADGQPVHHFRGLLDHLATLTKNTIQPQGGLPAFDQLTVPTPLQRQVFQRLDVPLSL